MSFPPGGVTRERHFHVVVSEDLIDALRSLPTVEPE